MIRQHWYVIIFQSCIHSHNSLGPQSQASRHSSPWKHNIHSPRANICYQLFCRKSGCPTSGWWWGYGGRWAWWDWTERDWVGGWGTGVTGVDLQWSWRARNRCLPCLKHWAAFLDLMFCYHFNSVSLHDITKHEYTQWSEVYKSQAHSGAYWITTDTVAITTDTVAVTTIINYNSAVITAIETKLQEEKRDLNPQPLTWPLAYKQDVLWPLHHGVDKNLSPLSQYVDIINVTWELRILKCRSKIHVLQVRWYQRGLRSFKRSGHFRALFSLHNVLFNYTCCMVV